MLHLEGKRIIRDLFSYFLFVKDLFYFFQFQKAYFLPFSDIPKNQIFLPEAVCIKYYRGQGWSCEEVKVLPDLVFLAAPSSGPRGRAASPGTLRGRGQCPPPRPDTPCQTPRKI